jgi:hypothetical protein
MTQTTQKSRRTGNVLTTQTKNKKTGQIKVKQAYKPLKKKK